MKCLLLNSRLSTLGTHEICPLPPPPRRLPGLKSPPGQSVPIRPTLQWGLALHSGSSWPPPLFGSYSSCGRRSHARESRRLTSRFRTFGWHHSRAQTQCSLESAYHIAHTFSSQRWAWPKWAGAAEALSPSLPLGQTYEACMTWPSSFHR